MQTSTNANSAFVPSRPSSVYFHTGIGGRGNYHKCDSATTASRPPPREHNRIHFPRSFRSIFGSGASRVEKMPPIADLDAVPVQEESARARARERSLTLRRFVGSGGMSNRHASWLVSDKSNEKDESHSGQALPYGAADIVKWRVGAVLGRRKTRDEDTVDMEKSFIKSLQDGIQS